VSRDVHGELDMVLCLIAQPSDRGLETGLSCMTALGICMKRPILKETRRGQEHQEKDHSYHLHMAIFSLIPYHSFIS
jgi:hypothetical protein